MPYVPPMVSVLPHRDHAAGGMGAGQMTRTVAIYTRVRRALRGVTARATTVIWLAEYRAVERISIHVTAGRWWRAVAAGLFLAVTTALR